MGLIIDFLMLFQETNFISYVALPINIFLDKRKLQIVLLLWDGSRADGAFAFDCFPCDIEFTLEFIDPWNQPSFIITKFFSNLEEIC